MSTKTEATLSSTDASSRSVVRPDSGAHVVLGDGCLSQLPSDDQSKPHDSYDPSSPSHPPDPLRAEFARMLQGLSRQPTATTLDELNQFLSQHPNAHQSLVLDPGLQHLAAVTVRTQSQSSAICKHICELVHQALQDADGDDTHVQFAQNGLLFAFVVAFKNSTDASSVTCLSRGIGSLIAREVQACGTEKDTQAAEIDRLCFCPIERNIILMNAFDFAPALVAELSKHASDAAVVVELVRTAHILAAADGDALTQFVAHGAVQCVIAVQNAHASVADIQVHAIAFLTAVMAAGREDVVATQLDVIESVVRELSHHREEYNVTVTYLTFLATAAVQPKSKYEVADRLAPHVGELVQTMQRYVTDLTVQIRACRVIRSIAVLSHQDMVTRAQAVPTIVTAMQQFPANATIQEHGLATLWALVTNSETRKIAIDNMAMEMAVRAIQKNPEQKTVARMAAGASDTSWSRIRKQKIQILSNAPFILFL
eukprot:c17557_g1_i2.p1 GENE.c17557_g1_i2~~c17557_g1_i2.p1  ORF type:complete len:484 (+),score=83.67 c17557_g1_i2:35-1486(+)